MAINANRISALALAACMLCGCTANKAAEIVSFKPSKGWILVRNGNIGDIKAAIAKYDALTKERSPESFKVELRPQNGKGVAVIFPKGLPAYDIANMTLWLDAPPSQEKVSGAVSWVVSPGSGIKYFLEPEHGNSSGDTLIGVSEQGQKVRIYAPETAMSELSGRTEYQVEPDIEASGDAVTLEITLDTDISFGNPMLVADSPRDFDWHPMKNR